MTGILDSFPRLREGRLLTLVELGEILNLKTEALTRRIARGSSLPVVTRIGRRPMFAPGDVASWLAAQRQETWTVKVNHGS